MGKSVLSVRVDDELIVKLEAVARFLHKSRSDLVEDVFLDFFAKTNLDIPAVDVRELRGSKNRDRR